MNDKKHTAIKIEYDDGTVEIVKRGCVIALGEKDENGGVDVDMIFATGDIEERKTVIGAVLTVLGVME